MDFRIFVNQTDPTNKTNVPILGGLTKFNCILVCNILSVKALVGAFLMEEALNLPQNFVDTFSSSECRRGNKVQSINIKPTNNQRAAPPRPSIHPGHPTQCPCQWGACHEARVTVTWRLVSRVTCHACSECGGWEATDYSPPLHWQSRHWTARGRPPAARHPHHPLSSLLPSCYWHTLPRPQPDLARGRGESNQADYYCLTVQWP